MTITAGPYATLSPEQQQAVLRECTPPGLFVDDQHYQSPVLLDLEMDNSGIRIKTVPEQRTPINQCECCHRADWVVKIAHSVDEAIDFGWLIPVDE